jgi:AraC-like DNA-binding protein
MPIHSTSQRGIMNPALAAEAFSLSRHEPSSDLAPLIERYWIVRWDLRGRPDHVQEVLPHPCVNLAIEPGSSAVHGVCTRMFRRTLSGQGQVFGVKFRPGGFHPFAQRGVSELTDVITPLAQVFGAGAHDLETAVLNETDRDRQVALVERFLRLVSPAHDPQVEVVVGVARTALDDRELTRVEDLAARAGLSVRALQRLFRAYVGVSPKWLLRRLRMHEAAERVASGAALDWAALSQELGYFDQAHFVRDFRAQTGRAPTEYAAECRAGGAPRPSSAA